MTVRYAHTNIVAKDYQKLAQFYVDVFDCLPLLPERDLAEPWLAAATAVPDARLTGVHLRLPGHGARGPTLEIFQYVEEQDRALPVAANRIGLAHLAFEVEDVEIHRSRVIAAGGQVLGDIVTAVVAGAGQITFTYVTDPEGNIVELQRWAPEPAQRAAPR